MDLYCGKENSREKGMVIELRHLQYVIAAAEHHSFRRAASVIGVQQSAISRRIRDVEDRVGTSLFTRHSAGVELTVAGRNFVYHARCAMAEIDRAAKLAGSSGRGEHGSVKLGVFSSLASGFIANLLRAYEAKNARVHIEYVEGAPREHIAAVRRYQLDVAFLTGRSEISDCDTEHFWTEKVFVVIPCDHPLAAQGRLSWEQLRDQHFIVSETYPGPEIHDYLIKHLAELGQHASVECCAVGRDNLMQIVSFGRGLSLTSEATTATRFPGVVYRELIGEELPFYAVWSPENDNPALRRLLSLARIMASRTTARGQSNIVRAKLVAPSLPKGCQPCSAVPSRNRDLSP